VKLLSTLKHWVLFGTSIKIRGYEAACIEAWRKALSPEAAHILDQQLQQMTFLQRLSSGKLLTFHSLDHDTLPLTFPNDAEELIVALVEIRTAGNRSTVIARIVLHLGKLSSLEFKTEPRLAGFTNDTDVEVVDIQLIADPMASRTDMKAGRIAEFSIPAWWGCLLRLSKIARIEKYVAPASDQSVQMLIKAHSGLLPDDYLEIIKQSDGVIARGVTILGAHELRSIVLPNHDLCAMAEFDDGDVLCLDESSAIPMLVLLRDDSPTPVPQRFCDALITELQKRSSNPQ